MEKQQQQKENQLCCLFSSYLAEFLEKVTYNISSKASNAAGFVHRVPGIT